MNRKSFLKSLLGIACGTASWLNAKPTTVIEQSKSNSPIGGTYTIYKYNQCIDDKPYTVIETYDHQHQMVGRGVYPTDLGVIQHVDYVNVPDTRGGSYLRVLVDRQ